MFSFSRGALLGLAAAGAYAVIVHWRRLPVILGVLGIGIALVVGVYKRDPGRFDTSFEVKGNVAQANIESRLDTWAAALKLTAEQPLLGVGPGNFKDYFSQAAGRPAGTEQAPPGPRLLPRPPRRPGWSAPRPSSSTWSRSSAGRGLRRRGALARRASGSR